MATRAQNLTEEAVSHGVTSMPKLRVSDVHLTPVNEATGMPGKQDREDREDREDGEDRDN